MNYYHIYLLDSKECALEQVKEWQLPWLESTPRHIILGVLFEQDETPLQQRCFELGLTSLRRHNHPMYRPARIITGCKEIPGTFPQKYIFRVEMAE